MLISASLFFLATCPLTAKKEIEVHKLLGVQTIAFIRKEGVMRVYLPDDIRPGDTITGTVVSEPTGNSDRELQKNASVLEGMVIDIGGQSRKGPGRLNFTIPALSAGGAPLVLKSADGKVQATYKTPIFSGLDPMPPVTSPGPSDFCLPPIAQTGNLLPIQGAFDGQASNTSVRIGDQTCPIFAESPRTTIALAPRAQIGTQSLELKEGGFTAVAPIQCIKVSLSAPKTTLLKGESTTVSVRVSGLEGLGAASFPIPFQFTNLSPDHIQMGSGPNIYRVLVANTAVKDGIWTSSVPILATIDGPFQVQGIILFDFNDDRKAKLPAKAINSWIAHLIANFEQEIREKEKDPNKQTRVDILRKVVSNLKSVKVTDNNALERGANLRAVDAQLDLISFLDVGSALVGVAADMLGYTDLPLQSILDILQAIKDLNIVSDNGLLDKAIGQTAVGMGIQDAKQKLQQIQKIKDALKELQDSIRKQIG